MTKVKKAIRGVSRASRAAMPVYDVRYGVGPPGNTVPLAPPAIALWIVSNMPFCEAAPRVPYPPKPAHASRVRITATRLGAVGGAIVLGCVALRSSYNEPLFLRPQQKPTCVEYEVVGRKSRTKGTWWVVEARSRGVSEGFTRMWGGRVQTEANQSEGSAMPSKPPYPGSVPIQGAGCSRQWELDVADELRPLTRAKTPGGFHWLLRCPCPASI